MLLLKQARAFGLGVVLSTQNPVDIDYKALSNAGTWMVGRLQTERDKARLLEGMASAAGSVDVGAVGDLISGLGKREFLLRRASQDAPQVFTTRWAMSYLRGPLTRDQLSGLRPGCPAAPAAAAPRSTGAGRARPRGSRPPRGAAEGGRAPRASRGGRSRDDAGRPSGRCRRPRRPPRPRRPLVRPDRGGARPRPPGRGDRAGAAALRRHRGRPRPRRGVRGRADAAAAGR